MEISRRKTIGPYRLLAEIGKGGLSHVYLAIRDGNPYALKCLKPDRVGRGDAVESFIREVKIGLRLDHPNIVKIIDHGKSDGLYFYVTPLLLGEALQEVLEEAKAAKEAPPLSLALYLIRESCRTLAYLHRTTVFENSTSVLVHGDFSPDNILLLSDGSVRLIDFGSATQETWAISDRRHYGKLFYVPPELLAGEAITTHTDLWALSVLSFYLLFGKRPFEATSSRLQKEMIIQAPVPRLDVSGIVKSATDEKALRILFQKALHKDRKMRHQSIKEFEQELFRIQFCQAEPTNLADVPKHLPPGVRTKIHRKDKEWVKLVSKAPKRMPTWFAKKSVVESIVPETIRRKYPRAAIADPEIFVEVVDSRERVLVSGEIQEMGVGGMLVRWKGRCANRGQVYAIVLHLGPGKPLVHGKAKVLYEVQIQSRSYVGFEFTEIPPNDFRILEETVESRISHDTKKKEAFDGERGGQVLHVRYGTEKILREEFEQNIAQGGLFVGGKHDLRPGDRVAVQIELPDSLRRVTVIGEVVFVTPKTEKKQGVALQLQGDPQNLRRLLLRGVGPRNS